MNELTDAASTKPKLNKAAITSKLDSAKANSRSSSQSSIANGIYKTLSPRRSQSKSEIPIQGLFDESSELHQSFSDHMLISPFSNVDKLNNDAGFFKKFCEPQDSVVFEETKEGKASLSNDEEEDDVLVDILPSFQFFDSLVKFLPDDTSEDNASFQYSSSCQNIPLTESTTLTSDSNPPDYFAMSENSDVREVRSSTTLSAGHSCALFSERYEVDKFYELPNRKLNSLDIKINLTKDPIEPNVISKREKLLREFSSGELINGYVTVENKSSLPIKFEGFYVSFEGVTTLKNKTEKKTYTKRFLKAHDLSATWSYGQVELASGVHYDTTIVDISDNTKLGLPNSKILEPKTKYKKYFCFKVPKEILDCNCHHQIPQHLALPPSYGLDRTDYQNSFIKLNNILGYGHTGLKGSPLLTPDLASYDTFVSTVLKQNLKAGIGNNKLNRGFNYEGSNISYSINCKLIMKDKGTSLPYILNNTSYSIRVIPNTLSSNRKYSYSNGKSSLVDSNCVKATLQNINVKAIKKIDDLEELLLKLEHWDDSSFIKDDLIIHLQNSKKQEKTDTNLLKSLPSGNKISETSSLPHYNGPILKGKNELKTISSQNIGVKNSFTSSLSKFNKLISNTNPTAATPSIDKTLIHSTNSNNNKFSIEAKFDKDLQALPYHRSFTISNYNHLQNKSKIDRKLWEKEVFQQLPVLPKDYELSSLPCTITTTNISGKNPSLKNVKASLCSYTVYSSKTNPIVLDANFLMTQEKLLEQIISNFKRHLEKIQTLKSLYINYQEKLNSLASYWNVDKNTVKFEAFIPKDLLNDLQAIASYNVEKFEMKNIFQPTVLSSSLSKWEKISETKSTIKFDVNLSYIDRLLLTILPSFDSCLISRFYHLEVECKFSNEKTAVLKVPIDVKHFK